MDVHRGLLVSRSISLTGHNVYKPLRQRALSVISGNHSGEFSGKINYTNIQDASRFSKNYEQQGRWSSITEPTEPFWQVVGLYTPLWDAGA